MTDSTMHSLEQGAVSGFLEDLRNRMGDNLQSVTLYGSAARGDFVEGSSDLNVLIVARSLGAEALRTAGDAIRHWHDRLPLSPIFATPDYLERSADVFPLEFLDMRDSHLALYGPDPLAKLEVDPRYLRHQVEAELKGKLMRLRSAYARASGDNRAVQALISESLPSFRLLFQGALRLRGETPPDDRAAVMSAVAAAFGLDAGVLEVAAAIRKGAPLPEDGAEGLMDRYLTTIEELTRAVDAWEGGSAA